MVVSSNRTWWYYAYDVQKAYVPSQATVMILPKCHLVRKAQPGLLHALTSSMNCFRLRWEPSSSPGRALFKEGTVYIMGDRRQLLVGGRLDPDLSCISKIDAGTRNVC
jgi:hypothetical protein